MYIISAFLLHGKLFKYNYYPGREIYTAIDKSKKINSSKRLVMGDSVANQIFDNEKEYDQLNSLATNQAISIAGQYFLLNDYLKAGNEIDTLLMIFVPWSFRNNLDQVYTYHYFLKPFYNSNYSHLFSKKVLGQIEKLEYKALSQLPPIKIIPWAPEFSNTSPSDFTFLSPISVEYLNKVSQLSKQYKFRIKIIPPPISFANKTFVESFDKSEILQTELSPELLEYFEKIKYIDEENFIDGTHLINPEKYEGILK